MEPIVPIYQQIRRTIRHWILDKKYGPNDMIPTEYELAGQFAVNRLTIRQALTSLVDEGLLFRKRGEGTFVTKNDELIQKMSLKHIGLTDEVLLPLRKSTTLTVEKTKIEPSTLVREKLELEKSESHVIKIKRDRLINEEFRVFTINYLPLEIGEQMHKKNLLQKPLLKIMEDNLKINFIEAFQTIEASFADGETAKHLGIPPGNPILLTERIMYAENGRPVELVYTNYEASQYKCCLQIKKIKRGSSYDWICQITK